MDKKKFYSKFLEKITQNMPDFAEECGLVGDYASFEETDYFKKDSKDEEILRKLDAALDKLIGFTGLLMLKTGLLTISEKDDVYKCENNVPDWESLGKILRNQKILSQAYGNPDRDFYGKNTLEEYLGFRRNLYYGRFHTYLCLLLTEYRESITFTTNDGDETRVFLNNYPNYDLHENIFTGIDFEQDILTIKDNSQMARLLLDNKLLQQIVWTKEEREERLKEQRMEMFFESGNCATRLLYKLVNPNTNLKNDMMNTISTFMATIKETRKIRGEEKPQDTIRRQLESLIGDREKDSGTIYVWMEIGGKWKPVPIFINKDYLSKFRTPEIRQFKENLPEWGIKQTDVFDKYMERKIDKFYKEYEKDQKTTLNFINWLIKEKHFYLYGKYLNYINQL